MGTRICFDVGFSSIKVATLIDGQIRYFKELNALSDLGSGNYNAYTGNERDIVAFNGKHYIVGKAALQAKDKRIISMNDFESMCFAAPIIATKYLRDFNPDEVEYICFTLSSAFLDKSKEFHTKLSEALPEYGSAKKIKLLPQGAGTKKSIDSIGLDVDNPTYKDSYKNYLIVDIGHNTIDVANVIGGSLIPDDIKGYEHTGAVLIAEEIQKQIKSKFDVDLNLDRVKAVIEDKNFKIRSDIYDCTEIVQKAVELYLEVLKDFLEKNYKDEMNAISNVLLCGGGAEIIRDNSNQWKEYFGEGFMIMPKVPGSSTFYNALGGLYLNVK